MSTTNHNSAWFNRRNASAIIEANDASWDAPLTDIYDALAEASWPHEAIEDAIEAWAC